MKISHKIQVDHVDHHVDQQKADWFESDFCAKNT